MNGRDPIAKETRDEAARWYARLNTTTVTTECLREFRAWKEIGDNREAYADIDAFWRRAEQLKGDPDIAQAGQDALERKSKPGPFKGPGGKGALAVLLAVGLGAAVAYGYRAYTGEPYSTEIGEQRLVRLEDGSRVRLDTDSQLKVKLSKAERSIELTKGQAFFEVAHDPSRPFIVHAEGTSVRALGTRFDVRRSTGKVQVTLLEGKVEVATALTSGPSSWILAPDQQITLRKGTASRELVDAAAATSWTSGRLVFQNQSLQSAIDEVNRYSRTQVVLSDAALGAIPVSGSFESGDTEAFVAAVKSLHNLTIQERTAREIRLAPAA
ncbi:MAG: iron dicitrate transport regulator FecR [Phenylobacterium sp.]|uniref:FecR family protein n=1 Tax=Phenylobacterium sp. TaxID=1871053 RepID=UPI0025D78F8E|nr:FecR family protein [Phenylobacterium sp.]MBA4010988.1 iron dicitrate transport regulator FecR [Phenylobacterium sp.]